jgi:hypothetical protein
MSPNPFSCGVDYDIGSMLDWLNEIPTSSEGVVNLES